MDASNCQQYIHCNNNVARHFTDTDNARLILLDVEFTAYIEDLKGISKLGHFFSEETYHALTFATKSLWTAFVISKPVKKFPFVLTGKMSSDPVESMFGFLHRSAGCNSALNVKSAISGLEKMLTTGIVATSRDSNVQSSTSFTSSQLLAVQQRRQASTHVTDKFLDTAPQGFKEHCLSERPLALNPDLASLAMIGGFIVRAQQPLDEAVAGPSGLTPPLRAHQCPNVATSLSAPRIGGGRRRQAVSPPAGPGPKRRRRRRGPIVDRETQISMEEMRANVQANNQRGRPDAFQNLAKLLCGPDVEALFRLPGRRLLSERLLRPWKLARTRPEPDEEEPLGEGEVVSVITGTQACFSSPSGAMALTAPDCAGEPAGGVQHSPARERRQEAEARSPCSCSSHPLGQEELSLAPPREGSLEVGREPSASSSGLHRSWPTSRRKKGSSSLVASSPAVAGTCEQAEPLVPIPEEMLPQEQEEALPEEELLGHGAVGPRPLPCAAASSSQLQEPGRMGSLWNRLQEVSDAHGMCTLESLVPPDAFNRRSVAGSFATLLRMHKRGMVHMEQFNAYGPVVVTVLKEDQGTPPLDEPHA
ncbi:hypothetical protein HPB48_009379 [Haemaphysalis longicornis]|uniref:Rad21/Rec8-like protein C-terminal eukaryotic domain-containing protein n=1 Tax=Haemaphysalis longicornis TaxID=44386 RepID=A0A9J6FD55_HAELO|nr:hypothetical protein HPB48_009379 [Haemaphysalis longicornis]